jgi:hypothetical protein
MPTDAPESRVKSGKFPENVGDLNTRDVVPLIREVEDRETLAAARAAEVARDGGPRETVMRTIERRKGQLVFDAAQVEVDNRFSPSDIHRMSGPSLREVAAVKGIEWRYAGVGALRKRLLRDFEAPAT